MPLVRRLLILFVDLHGKFARGQQDQSAGLGRGFLAEHFDDRDQKGESLAGAGLGGADYIFSFKSGLDGALLDRR